MEHSHELLLQWGSLGQDDLPTLGLLVALGRIDVHHGADGVSLGEGALQGAGYSRLAPMALQQGAQQQR